MAPNFLLLANSQSMKLMVILVTAFRSKWDCLQEFSCQPWQCFKSTVTFSSTPTYSYPCEELGKAFLQPKVATNATQDKVASRKCDLPRMFKDI